MESGYKPEFIFLGVHMFLSVIPVNYIVLSSIVIVVLMSLYLSYTFYRLYIKTNHLSLESNTGDDDLTVKNSRKSILISFIGYWIITLPILGYMIMLYVTSS